MVSSMDNPPALQVVAAVAVWRCRWQRQRQGAGHAQAIGWQCWQKEAGHSAVKRMKIGGASTPARPVKEC